ncbi:MAG: M3 family metallopeptidase [Deltaproteobacteria bacterium]
MRRLTALTTLVLAACATPAAKDPEPAMTKAEEAPKEAAKVEPPANPFFAGEWKTPYGAPPFDRITDDHYAPAFDEGMKQHVAEMEKIANNEEEATFANTIEAMERTGDFLERVENVFFNLAGSTSNDAIVKLRGEYAPKLSKHYDAIYLNDDLWQRVNALYQKRTSLGLQPQQAKLLEEYYKGFVRAGARLDPERKQRLADINAELAGLYSKFVDHVRLETEKYALVVDDEKDLEGLPDAVVAAGAAEAKAREMEGKWAFTTTRSSITPFLQYAKNRKLREQIYKAYITRGANGDDLDNQKLILAITKLRAERAKLLGFESHAHYNIDKNMAKTPKSARMLLERLWKGAIAKAKVERKLLQAEMKKDLGRKAKLMPWDWQYYAEKVRKKKFDLSQDELKPYFQVDMVRQGAFDTASRLFGITFEEVTDGVPRYHPEVKAFDVKDKDGTHVGLLYVDYHPRKGKRGGAWMNVFRAQSNLDGKVRPVVVNVGNFPAPAGDKPALLGWDEVETLFHEFGHALHGLLSNVKYESLAGTRVKRDYVEFPSQLLENWALERSVVEKYARHYETNEPIPAELVEKLLAANNWNQGFAMTELVGAALLDLEWHTMNVDQTSKVTDVLAFDKKAKKRIGFIEEIEPRYHSTYFQHIFAGDGYSAGYYVYLWAQVLEADAFKAFQEKKDAFDPALAAKLRTHIFAAGGSDDEMVLYKKFRGREPNVKALLEKRDLGR